ncbi:ribonucleotide reductase inhibitor-domain-containing protein [Hypoxylon sp. FL1857]|nr:ribonucleotide reductase inhibitor-domain-containing protein [Hypoxylon sp. FL1857]
MSAPRTKRQFAGAASDPAQRQITSFFSSALPSPSSSNSQHVNASSPIVSPPLPASVQANLLSVGMRVRKSVPEGYKTGNYSAFALWDESSNCNFKPSSTTHTTMGEGRSRANAISTPRELLPFCGIHKVGGLGTQPENATPSPSPYTSTYTSSSTTYQPLLSVNGLPLDDDSMDDVPGLTSSQESIESTDSNLPISPTKTRKRSYTEDEEDKPETPGHLNLNVNFNVWRDTFDGEVSPRSQAPAGWAPSNGRIMAVPRKAKYRGSKLAAQAMDQENVMVVESGADGADFEEADFLVRTAELEYRDGSRGWEVEMSDV